MNVICISLVKLSINTFTAGAIFLKPPRNADDEITRHLGGFGFFFASTLRLIFTLISEHFVILVIVLPHLLKLF